MRRKSCTRPVNGGNNIDLPWRVFFPPSDDYGNKLIRTRFSMGKTTCMLWRYFLSKLIAEAEINKMANVVET